MVQADPAKRHRHLPLGIGAGSSETHSWLVFLCAFPFGNLSLDLMVPCLSLLAWLFFYDESPLKYWLANRSHIQPIYLHFHHPFRVPWI